MEFLRQFAPLTVVVGALVSGCAPQTASSVVTAEMAGSWKGEARIIVSWCEQERLPLALTIASDGGVAGLVGDAELMEGRLEQNRGWVGRKLDVATDLIITGKLDGPLVRSEGITRESVTIPLNYADGTFSGGLHTSGEQFGGKEAMKLSATELRLEKSRP